MSRKYQSHWPLIPQNEQKWREERAKYSQLVIEIGAGQGLHAIQYAESHPDTLYIAIERTQTKFARMASRLEHHPHIQNLLLLNQDAIPWISSNIGPAEVDAYFILYPNPYPKAGQANKRWHYMPFMDYLIETLKPRGSVTMATNIESYYREACVEFERREDVNVTSTGEVPTDFKGRTHFERKYLERGETCYELALGK